MARTTDSTGRQKRLESALERAKELPADAILDAQPMAQLVGVSWPSLRAWCDDIDALAKAKCFIRGGNGVKWQFKPLLTVETLLGYFRAEAERRSQNNRRLQQSVGVQLPETERAATLDETRQLVRLTLEVTQAKMDQGEYTPTATVADFLDGYNRTVVEAIMGVETEIDPTGKLEPMVRQAVNEALRSVATRVHANAEKFIGEYRARTQQAGVATRG